MLAKRRLRALSRGANLIEAVILVGLGALLVLIFLRAVHEETAELGVVGKSGLG